MRMLLLSSFAVTTVLAADFPPPADLPASAAPPDPLVMRDGSRITTADDWKTKRVPELRALFQHYMYGARPAAPAVSGKVIHEDAAALGGKATVREIEVGIGLDAPVRLLLVTPNAVKQPVACFLGMNFNGNFQLLDDPKIAPPRWTRDPKAAADANRGKERDTWAIEQSIARGYAVANFYSGDIVPDDKVPAEVALRKIRAGGGDERGPADTATIMAWSWGFSCMVDYLLTVPGIDGKRIALVGHSRNGKTALLAAAFDERIAMTIPSQAGCGGTAPSRMDPNSKGRPKSETVRIINGNFPHWFCGHFKAFNDAVEKLPFDQHSLIALCAPRPVLLSNAEQDVWANPDGQFAMLRAAAPVYALLGEKINPADQRPPLDTLLSERLGYHIRPGKHSMTKSDWAVWLDYADKWLQ